MHMHFSDKQHYTASCQAEKQWSGTGTGRDSNSILNYYRILRSFLFFVRASVANDDSRVSAGRFVDGDGEALRSSMVSSTSCQEMSIFTIRERDTRRAMRPISRKT